MFTTPEKPNSYCNLTHSRILYIPTSAYMPVTDSPTNAFCDKKFTCDTESITTISLPYCYGIIKQTHYLDFLFSN